MPSRALGGEINSRRDHTRSDPLPTTEPTETMDRTSLLSRIDATKSLDFLAAMIQHKSYSGTPEESELSRFMVERLKELGLEAELQPLPDNRFNAIGRFKGTGGGPSLLFNGHLDTNPVTEGWTVDPWGGLYDKDFIYGIGVSNMKAGDAAYFCALRTLMDNGVRLRGDVVLTFVVGELQGGIGTVTMIDKGTRADYFINSEPTDLAGLTLHAGAFNFAVELTGITRHVSKREEAVDAIMAACRLIPHLNGMTFSGAANPDHLSVNRCNVGVVRGSLTPEFHDWRPPQIADYVRLAGTARYAPSQSEESVLRDIRGVLDELENAMPGLKSKVLRDPGRPARARRCFPLRYPAIPPSWKWSARPTRRCAGRRSRWAPCAPTASMARTRRTCYTARTCRASCAGPAGDTTPC